MSRTDRASRVVDGSPEDVYVALVDPDALSTWLPPAGMRAEFERHDARPGGGYRMILTYLDSVGSPGKSTSDSDVVEARYVELEPGVRVVQEVQFESDDPAYAGTMTMTWALERVENGTRVEFRAEGAPPGISAEDHEAGLASSLQNLAHYLGG
ncbi:MAG TPA: SRPBCC family protein [Nocardioides sp.]|nr:SRPBCC family protein [Nocardioides sp.]